MLTRNYRSFFHSFLTTTRPRLKLSLPRIDRGELLFWTLVAACAGVVIFVVTFFALDTDDSRRLMAIVLRLNEFILLPAMVLAGTVLGSLVHWTFSGIARRLHHPTHPDGHGELTGHFFGVVGVIYAVVVGFVVVTAWEQRDHTEEISIEEQGSTRDLFHAISAYGGQRASTLKIQYLLNDYATNMLGEWDQMQKLQPLCVNNDEEQCKHASSKSPSMLNDVVVRKISQDVFALHATNVRNEVLYERSIALVENLLESRNHRRHHYDDPALPAILWLSFLVGGAILVGVTYFLVNPDAGSQPFRTTALCAMIGMMVALAIVFDYPFTGSSGIPRAGWDDVVQHICSNLNVQCPPTNRPQRSGWGLFSAL